MKFFFDTSVLVPAVLEDHEHHERSLAVISKARPQSSCCAAHSLAELYATLTRYPGKQRLSPDQALMALEGMEERLAIVALDVREYRTAIRKLALNGITGGTLYDGLIAACALKAKADVFYTWNIDDFRRLGPEVAQIVETP